MCYITYFNLNNCYIFAIQLKRKAMKTKHTKGDISLFEGSPTECYFNNGMSLELWYGYNHKRNEAIKTVEHMQKCWNMHDELIEAVSELNELIGRIDMRSKHDPYPLQIKVNELIKKATE